jgi:hypothetical protein
VRTAHTRALGLAAHRLKVRAREDIADAFRKHRPQEGWPVRCRGVLFPGDAPARSRPFAVEWTFYGLHNVTQGDLGWTSRKRVASSWPAFALNEPGAAKALEDLFEVAGGNVLPFADHPDLDRVALPVVREVEHSAYCVLDLEGEPHRALQSARMSPAMPSKTWREGLAGRAPAREARGAPGRGILRPPLPVSMVGLAGAPGAPRRKPSERRAPSAPSGSPTFFCHATTDGGCPSRLYLRLSGSLGFRMSLGHSSRKPGHAKGGDGLRASPGPVGGS